MNKKQKLRSLPKSHKFQRLHVSCQQPKARRLWQQCGGMESFSADRSEISAALSHKQRAPLMWRVPKPQGPPMSRPAAVSACSAATSSRLAAIISLRIQGGHSVTRVNQHQMQHAELAGPSLNMYARA